MRGGAAAPTWLAMRRSASSSSSPFRARSRSSVSACGAVTHQTSSHSPSHLRVVGVGVGPSRHVAARPPNTPRCISYTWRHGRPYLGAKPLVHGPGMALAWRWHGADTGPQRTLLRASSPPPSPPAPRHNQRCAPPPARPWRATRSRTISPSPPCRRRPWPRARAGRWRRHLRRSPSRRQRPERRRRRCRVRRPRARAGRSRGSWPPRRRAGDAPPCSCPRRCRPSGPPHTACPAA